MTDEQDFHGPLGETRISLWSVNLHKVLGVLQLEE